MATEAQLERLREFIAPPRIAMVATIGKDGMPQLTPNWYAYTGEEIIVSITKQRVKYRNVLRDPRAAISICSEPLAEEYVTVSGPGQDHRRGQNLGPDAGNYRAVYGGGKDGRVHGHVAQAGPRAACGNARESLLQVPVGPGKAGVELSFRDLRKTPSPVGEGCGESQTTTLSFVVPGTPGTHASFRLPGLLPRLPRLRSGTHRCRGCMYMCVCTFRLGVVREVPHPYPTVGTGCPRYDEVAPV